MQLFESTSFFIVSAVLCVPAIILGILEKPIKYYGFVASVLLVVWAMADSVLALSYLAGYVVFEYILVNVYSKIRESRGRDAKFYYLFLVLSILPLFLNKMFGLVEINIFGFLGISYMTFKSIQIIMEMYDGLIKSQKLFAYLYLMLFFPAFLSGPIDRSRRFESDINSQLSRKDYLQMLGDALFKMVLGIAYKFVLAAIFYNFVLELENGRVNVLNCYGYMFVYGVYLFFDFAGYSLMAIGMGKVFGIELPINFNKPFISVDIKDFWNRWHISLSHWFRDFVFSRLMMKCIRNKWFKDRVKGAAVCLIINMTIMGVWHGITFSYILYGIYHGVLLAITEIYQKKSKFYKKNKKKNWYKTLSWFLTLHLVMAGFFIFSGRFEVVIGKVIAYLF